MMAWLTATRLAFVIISQRAVTAQYISGPFNLHVTGKTNASINGMKAVAIVPIFNVRL